MGSVHSDHQTPVLPQHFLHLIGLKEVSLLPDGASQPPFDFPLDMCQTLKTCFLVATVREDSTGILCVLARDDVELPTVHRTHSTTVENYVVPNMTSSEFE